MEAQLLRSSALNAFVNTFTELKKLKPGLVKCATDHIGSKDSKTRCQFKKIHCEDMKHTVGWTKKITILTVLDVPDARS